MAWYYNSDIGAVREYADWYPFPELHLGLGWHGPFATKDDAIKFYEDNKAANPGWKAPTGTAGNIINATPGGSAAADKAKQIVDPLGGFNIGAWFIRIGEILLGIVLVGVGVARLTGASNVVSSALKVKV